MLKGLITTLLVICSLTGTLLAQPCDCVTTGNCPVSIQDNGTFQGTLDVTVNGANDLGACPLTSLCFQITHTWVGDLAVTLTSPSGVNYMVMADVNNNFSGCGNQNDNIDVCIIPGTGNPLTNNTEYICNTGPCPSGTCCLTGLWTMPCGGVTDPVTGAQQAPNCDLNDFNIPGQPANGTWTLTINDICSNDVGTLDNFTLTFACGTLVCTVCEADGGTFNEPAVTGCVGSPGLNLSLTPQYSSNPPPNPAEYSYSYVIVQNDIIVSIVPSPDMSAQPPGTYQVCGLSYLTVQTGLIFSLVGLNYTVAVDMLESTTAPFCGDMSGDCVDVIIGPPIPPTIIDTLVCIGTCIEIAGQEVCSSTTITLTSWLNCDSVIEVILIPIVIPPTEDTIAVCEGQCIEINNQTICGPGTHIINFTSYQGCDSTLLLFVEELPVSAVIQPPDPPQLSCTVGNVTLDGSASTPIGAAFQWSGPGGFNDTLSIVSVSTPGTYELIVVNNSVSPPCSDTTSIEVTFDNSGPDLQVNGPVPELCFGDSLDLDTLNITDLNNTGADITFHSAYPPTPANQLPATTVAPNSSTTYYILAAISGCQDVDSLTITVNPLPQANITGDTVTCLDSLASVAFGNSADTMLGYFWNFDGGNAAPGTGAGPHSIQWFSVGTKVITLIVEDSSGCVSTPDTLLLQVEPPLSPPVLNCLPTNTTITFVWPPVMGATGYQVQVLSGQSGTMTSDTSFVVNGLSPLEAVTIQVVALSGNSCGDVSQQITCSAQDCPSVTLSIDPVDSICLNSNTPPVQLVANMSGGAGGGTLVWGGSPAVHPITGVFLPGSANTGANNIFVTYAEGLCQYNASTTVQVNPTPSSSFTLTNAICFDETALATYTGTSGSSATYFWDFAGGSATPGSGAGPQNIAWTTPGNYSVSLYVLDNNCFSDTTTLLVTVGDTLLPPQISCQTTTNSITFTWQQVTGASGYNFTISTGQSATSLSDTSQLIAGLLAGETATVEVEAIGTGPCGSSFAIAECTASNCPPVTLDIAPVSICRDAASQPFDLTVNITGGSPGGSLTWSGNAITNAINGTFDPALALAGDNTVTAVYEEGNCSYSASQIVPVSDVPDADFDVPDAVCLGDTTLLMYSGTNDPALLYHWDFGTNTAIPGAGAGPHQIVWNGPGSHTLSLWVENNAGCTSDTAVQTVDSYLPVTAPAITCSSNTNSVLMSWNTVPGATLYETIVLQGPIGISNPGQYIFSGLTPGDSVTLLLVVSGDGPCPPDSITQTCMALDCPSISIDIEPVPDICLGNMVPFNLIATVTGSSGSGAGIWSGPGIIDPNAGIFDAFAAGFGQHSVAFTFVEDGCTFSSNALINIYEEPTAIFETGDTVCIADPSEVVYTGSAAANSTYVWSFGNGAVLSGSGQGPYTISWPQPGLNSLSLVVTENGCTSKLYQRDVQVDDTLSSPSIQCVNSSTQTVTFAWTDVPGADAYDVTVLSGQTGTFVGNTNYQVSGLTPAETVTIALSVSGAGVCPPVTITHSCEATDCPPVDLAIEPVAPRCFGSANDPITLSATAGGMPVSGTWSGTGITNPSSGTFDPTGAGVGAHLITFTWAQANCIFQTTTTILIVAPPTADAGPDDELTCREGETSSQLGGAATTTGPNISYDWDFSGGAFPGDSTIAHPTISVEGTFTLTVTDELYGCSASGEVTITSSQDIPMPQVSISPISCFGENDGAIVVTGVNGGEPPYFYSLNGSPFSESGEFHFLQPGDFTLTVMDVNGCEATLMLNIYEPPLLTVNLVAYLEGENIIHLGDSAQLEAIVSLHPDSIDNIDWDPDSLLSCSACLNPVIQPIQTTTFTVTVESKGCSDSDKLTVFVRKDRLLYVPTAFSPNNDGVNDLFRVFPGLQARRIQHFRVFDRWGETVYSHSDFDPNDPAIGWDGRFRGQRVDPGVFTWFAEVEFLGGSSVLFEGDVTLMK